MKSKIQSAGTLILHKLQASKFLLLLLVGLILLSLTVRPALAAPGPFSLSGNAYCNTTPPVAPAVRLNWTASSGATSYDIYRNGSLYALGVTGTTFDNNANVAAGQTYTYNVVARNSTGTTQSNAITVTVPTNVCPTPPTPPGSFSLSGNAYCNTTPPVAPAVRLNWSASSGATSYDIYRNGALYASGVTGTTYDNNANVAAGQTYSYYVVARNSTGSTQSKTITVTVPVNVCGTPPTPPGSFSLSGNAYCNTTPPVAPAVKLTWTASSGATSYDIYRNGALYASGVTGTTFDNNANVAAGQTYSYYVVARNSTGTTQSNAITIPVPSDICAAALIPAAPSNLIATAGSSSTASLTWTDNSSNESGFKIERKTGTSGAYSQIGTQGANLNFFNDSGLAASTQYCYRVRAYNSAGDSAYSNEACTTTAGAQTFSISGQVTSGGNGAAGVTVSLSGAASKSTTTDSNGNYTFTGLSNGSYTIAPNKTGCTFSPTTRAATISGSNVTGQNFTATCSTGPGAFTLSASAYCNRTPPVAPAVKLIWTASSGVTSYDVYRNGTLYAPGVTGTSFDNNANVTAGQTYTYYVVAKNSTGSTQSNTISVAVPNNVCAVISEPLINEISPISGLPGATVAIRGSGFSSTVGTVRFSSKSATVQAWSDSVIHITVPSLSAGTYNVTVVTSSSKGSNGKQFTVLAPVPIISSLNPNSGTAGTIVTIMGTNFGSSPGSSFVSFGSMQASVVSWSNTRITAMVPLGPSGNVPVTVTTPSGTSNGNISFSIVIVPVVLVHGWCGSPSEETWGQMKELLEAEGFNVDYANYSAVRNETMADLADNLRLDINRIRRHFNLSDDAKVDVIAHSRGGLAARAFMTNMHSSADRNPYSDDIRKLIMVGTPNYGAAGAKFGSLICSEPADEMEFGSHFIWVLHQNWKALQRSDPGVRNRILIIAGTVGLGLDSNDDGLVNVSSAPLSDTGADRVAYVPYKHSTAVPSLPFDPTQQSLINVKEDTVANRIQCQLDRDVFCDLGQNHKTFRLVKEFLEDGTVLDQSTLGYTPPDFHEGMLLMRLVDSQTGLGIPPSATEAINLDFSPRIFRSFPFENPYASTVTVEGVDANPRRTYRIMINVPDYSPKRITVTINEGRTTAPVEIRLIP